METPSCCCPVSWRFYGFGMAGLADYVDYGVDQFRALDLGLGVAELSAHQLSLFHSTRVSSPVLLGLGHPMPQSAGGRAALLLSYPQGQLLPLPSPPHPYLPNQFHCVAQSRHGGPPLQVMQLVKGLDSSFAWGSFHLCLCHQGQLHCVAQAKFKACSLE